MTQCLSLVYDKFALCCPDIHNDAPIVNPTRAWWYTPSTNGNISVAEWVSSTTLWVCGVIVQTRSTKGTRMASPTQRVQVEHHGVRSVVMNYPDIKLNLVVPPYWLVLSALETLRGTPYGAYCRGCGVGDRVRVDWTNEQEERYSIALVLKAECRQNPLGLTQHNSWYPAREGGPLSTKHALRKR